MKKTITIFSLLVTVFSTSKSYGQYSTEPTQNTKIIGLTGFNHINPKTVSDGNGGAIIIWEDDRNGNKDIFAQRINKYGFKQWSTDGIVVCNASGDQLNTSIISDNTGGIIVAWSDDRGSNTDVYAQRIDSTGSVSWNANGLLIGGAAGNDLNPALISNANGEAIITWINNGLGNYAVYVQKVSSLGVNQWTSNGNKISNDNYNLNMPKICSDGSNGAFVTWYQDMGTSDVFVNRIDANGSLVWNNYGVNVTPSFSSSQSLPEIISDGNNGAVIAWQDYRDGTVDYYAQKIDALGSNVWTSTGLPISVIVGNENDLTLQKDRVNGIFFSWTDKRLSGNDNIYAQYVNAAGNIQWTTNGIAVASSSSNEYRPKMITDTLNNVIITWYGDNFDLYASKLNNSGVSIWMNVPTVYTSAVDMQVNPSITSDGKNGAIIVWEDYRNTTTAQVYLQQICQAGYLGAIIPSSPDTITGNIAVNEGSINTYTVTPVVGAYLYTWSLSNGFTGTSTTNSISVTTGATSGTISVRAESPCGYSEFTHLNITVTPTSGGTSGIEENSNSFYKIYPNPTKGIISIDFVSNENSTIEVYSIIGEKIYESPASSMNEKIDLSNERKGIYFVKVKNGVLTKTSKIILE